MIHGDGADNKNFGQQQEYVLIFDKNTIVEKKIILTPYSML